MSIITYYSSNDTYFSFLVSAIRPRGALQWQKGRMLLTAAVDIINCVRVRNLGTRHAEREAYLCTATFDRIYEAVAKTIRWFFRKWDVGVWTGGYL